MTLNRVAAACANAGWPCECRCAQRVPRYPADLADEQWAVLEPLVPVMLCDTELGGRPEKPWQRTMIVRDQRLRPRTRRSTAASGTSW